MNTDDALAFLRAHQPMPSDAEITEAQGATYAKVLRHFENNPDERCIPLLVGSISATTNLGVYEHVVFTLRAHRREAVLPHLREALVGNNEGVQYRCCWWAADFQARELASLVEPLRKHENQDIRVAASAFFEALPRQQHERDA